MDVQLKEEQNTHQTYDITQCWMVQVETEARVRGQGGGVDAFGQQSVGRALMRCQVLGVRARVEDGQWGARLNQFNQAPHNINYKSGKF